MQPRKSMQLVNVPNRGSRNTLLAGVGVGVGVDVVEEGAGERARELGKAVANSLWEAVTFDILSTFDCMFDLLAQWNIIKHN